MTTSSGCREVSQHCSLHLCPLLVTFDFSKTINYQLLPHPLLPLTTGPLYIPYYIRSLNNIADTQLLSLSVRGRWVAAIYIKKNILKGTPILNTHTRTDNPNPNPITFKQMICSGVLRGVCALMWLESMFHVIPEALIADLTPDWLRLSLAYTIPPVSLPAFLPLYMPHQIKAENKIED